MDQHHDPYPTILLAGTDPDLPPDVPTGYDKYSDFREMARGGKAVLHSCWDSVMGRAVALKTLLPKFADDERERRRFLREARVTAQLQHPNTVPVYEIGRDLKDCLYFTMKKIAGENLFKILQRLSWGDATTEKRYPLSERLEIVIQTCNALSYAHKHGVIHRDVKPENIWIGEFAEVILLDWGVAKVWGVHDDSMHETDDPADDQDALPGDDRDSPQSQEAITSAAEIVESGEPKPQADHKLATQGDPNLRTLTLTGQRPGTPLYMSPEQVLGNKYLDYRTDIFSMGVMLYEMLTFREPFRGENVRETFNKIVYDLPMRPSGIAPKRGIPPSLDAIVMRAISKKPDERFETMDDMIHDLRLSRFDVLRKPDAEEASS